MQIAAVLVIRDHGLTIKVENHVHKVRIRLVDYSAAMDIKHNLLSKCSVKVLKLSPIISNLWHPYRLHNASF
jgi:hypothetical protein